MNHGRIEECFHNLLNFTHLSLLLLRLVVALVFVTSGLSHVKDPKKRAKSIGLSAGFTAFLGVAAIMGRLEVAFSVLIQLAAIGLKLLMLGAIQEKIFVWHTGFWEGKPAGCPGDGP